MSCGGLQDAVLELGNELRWVDEEGVKARLEAESVLRSRIDGLASRVDAVEEIMVPSHGKPAKPVIASLSGDGSLSKRFSGPQSVLSSAPSHGAGDSAVPRDTLVKHVRVRVAATVC